MAQGRWDGPAAPTSLGHDGARDAAGAMLHSAELAETTTPAPASSFLAVKPLRGRSIAAYTRHEHGSRGSARVHRCTQAPQRAAQAAHACIRLARAACARSASASHEDIPLRDRRPSFYERVWFEALFVGKTRLVKSKLNSVQIRRCTPLRLRCGHRKAGRRGGTERSGGAERRRAYDVHGALRYAGAAAVHR